MNCAQSGCEISNESLMEAGAIPRNCPTCGHPLRLVASVDEVADMTGLPVEEAPAGDDPLLGGGDDTNAPE